MREYTAEFERLHLKVAVITFENDYFARQYLAESGLDWPLLVDEAREQYRYYGMLQASFRDLWGPENWWPYPKELLKDRKLRLPTNDIHQRGGDVLIDPHGVVRLHHIGSGPSDRPSVEALLRRVAEGVENG